MERNTGEQGGYILDLFRGEESEGTNFCILVAGQVNSGKSTLCRQLVNSLLAPSKPDQQAYTQVAWIDCDSGQPEFTPPCLVSLHMLSAPVEGGPLEHQRSGDVQFFTGDPSPRPDKEYYIQCIFTLFQRYQELAQAAPTPIPLVINTNGWVKGVGGTLLGRIVQYCQPRMIVQLLKNTSSPTTPDLIDFQAWSPRSGIVSLPAFDGDQDGVPHEKDGMSAKSMRDLLIMKYFQCDQTPLAAAIPYRVSWNTMRVRFMFSPVCPSMALYALNGTVVALCVDSTRYRLAHDNHVEEHQRFPHFLSSTPICDCVGYGLIRAIDPDQRCYYIVTPVPPEQLMQVNTILKGNVELPTFAFMEGGVMNAPYLCSNSLSASDGTSGITPMNKKRPDIPRRRLAQ